MQFVRQACRLCCSPNSSILQKKGHVKLRPERFNRCYSSTESGVDIDEEEINSKPRTPKQIKRAVEAADFLTKLSEAEQRQLKLYQLEYELLYSMGKRVPSKMEDWQYVCLLQQCPTTVERNKMYTFWSRAERFNIKGKKIAEEKIKLNGFMEEGVMHGNDASLYLDPQLIAEGMNKVYNSRIAHSAQFGPHILVDLELVDETCTPQIRAISLQTRESHRYNKLEPEPFHFIFTSCQKVGGSAAFVPGFSTINSIPYTFTEKHYLDLFRRHQLVYLSPYADVNMKKYDPNKVYILGGIGLDQSVMLDKVSQENVQCLKFPIDRHVMWRYGSKDLTLSCVVKIMHGLKRGEDWKTVLHKHIPLKHLRHAQGFQRLK